MTDEIELKLDEDNEVLFRVAVEGTREPASVRFVCENGDVSYMFKGTVGEEPGEVKINVPAMQKQLAEGTYNSRLEVLIENRYFSPIQLNVRFKKGVSVVAEAVIVQPKKIMSEIKVVAATTPKVVAKPGPIVQKQSLREKFEMSHKKVLPSVDLNEDEILEAAASFVAANKNKRK